MVVHIIHQVVVACAVVAIFRGEHVDAADTTADGTAVWLYLRPQIGRIKHHAVNTGLASILSGDRRRAGGGLLGESGMMQVGTRSGEIEASRMAW